jgi:hypothetical protein
MNRVVVHVKSLHFDSIRSQQPHLRIDYGVFSAPLLVPIVNHQYFHAIICTFMKLRLPTRLR